MIANEARVLRARVAKLEAALRKIADIPRGKQRMTDKIILMVREAKRALGDDA